MVGEIAVQSDAGPDQVVSHLRESQGGGAIAAVDQRGGRQLGEWSQRLQEPGVLVLGGVAVGVGEVGEDAAYLDSADRSFECGK